ncbi:MAG: Type 1 glutamine amidotransferase-like domain-containing protein [Chloroflexota bacterium]
MKLLLTSFETSAEQDQELARLIGKDLRDVKVAYIENAYDVYHDEESLIEGRESQRRKGYDVEVVDLREWQAKPDRAGLREKLASKDMFLFAGGNPFYLRWLLKVTGADEIITELVQQGKVYVGASAGGVVAGPTLRHFDNQDDPSEAEEVIWEGLNLTPIILVPHIDNADFGAGCREAGEKLKAEGYPTQFITDTQAFLINGDEQRVI